MNSDLAPVRINPADLYRDRQVRELLGIPASTLARARRMREIRFIRKGQSVIYEGQWILDWLASDDASQDDSGAVDLGSDE